MNIVPTYETKYLDVVKIIVDSMIPTQVESLMKVYYQGELDQFENKIQKLPDNPRKLILQAHLAHDRGDFDSQKDLAERVINEFTEFGEHLEACYLYSWSLHRQGQNKEAYNIALLAYKKLDDYDRDQFMYEECLLLKVLGTTSMETGLEESIHYKELGLNLAMKTGNQIMIAQAINSRATLSYYIGDYKVALDEFLKSFEICEREDYPFGKLISSVNVGEIYRRLGLFDKAIEYLEMCISLSRRFNHNFGLGFGLWALGKALFNLSRYDEATIIFTEAIEAWTAIGNDLHLAYSLFALGKLKITIGEEVEEIIDQLQLLLAKTDNPIIKHAYWLLQGVYQKQSTKMIDRGHAMAYLKKIVDDKLLYFEFTYEATLHFTDLLLQQFMITRHEYSFELASEYVNQLLDVTLQQNALIKIIDIRLLKAKLQRIAGNINSAKQELHEAQAIAVANDFPQYEAIVEKELVELDEELQVASRIAQEHKPTLERLHNSNILSYLGDIAENA